MNGHDIDDYNTLRSMEAAKGSKRTNREELKRARAKLRANYAGLIDLGNVMRQKGMVQWSKERHCWVSYYMYDRRGKDRKAIMLLLRLQDQIKEQAMLLLELEYAIDREEGKQSKTLMELHAEGKL